MINIVHKKKTLWESWEMFFFETLVVLLFGIVLILSFFVFAVFVIWQFLQHPRGGFERIRNLGS